MEAARDTIRDAATIVLVRDRTREPRILVGRRGSTAVFMPDKFVFPGGAVDAADGRVRLRATPTPLCMTRLTLQSAMPEVGPLLACAVRELWEETGIRLAEAPDPAGRRQDLPEEWVEFCADGMMPSARSLVFFYRAITPPGRTRRFDARFFYGDVDEIPLAGDPDQLDDTSGELLDLQWVRLSDTGELDFPFITRLVISRLLDVLPCPGPPPDIPFRFQQDGIRKLTTL